MALCTDSSVSWCPCGLTSARQAYRLRKGHAHWGQPEKTGAGRGAHPHQSEASASGHPASAQQGQGLKYPGWEKTAYQKTLFALSYPWMLRGRLFNMGTQ